MSEQIKIVTEVIKYNIAIDLVTIADPPAAVGIGAMIIGTTNIVG